MSWMDSIGSLFGGGGGSSTPSSGGGGGLWDAIASPQGIAAIITTGAGYLGGRDKIKQEQALMDRQNQKDAMNAMLELSKMQYQLGMAGSGGGGGGAAPGPTFTPQDYIATIENVKQGQSGALKNLGNNLSQAYRRY